MLPSMYDSAVMYYELDPIVKPTIQTRFSATATGYETRCASRLFRRIGLLYLVDNSFADLHSGSQLRHIHRHRIEEAPITVHSKEFIQRLDVTKLRLLEDVL